MTHIVLPAQMRERDGVDVLVENKRKGDREVEYRETLRTNRKRQNFDRVRDDERREGDAKMICMRLANCQSGTQDRSTYS